MRPYYSVGKTFLDREVGKWRHHLTSVSQRTVAFQVDYHCCRHCTTPSVTRSCCNQRSEQTSPSPKTDILLYLMASFCNWELRMNWAAFELSLVLFCRVDERSPTTPLSSSSPSSRSSSSSSSCHHQRWFVEGVSFQLTIEIQTWLPLPWSVSLSSSTYRFCWVAGWRLARPNRDALDKAAPPTPVMPPPAEVTPLTVTKAEAAEVAVAPVRCCDCCCWAPWAGLGPLLGPPVGEPPKAVSASLFVWAKLSINPAFAGFLLAVAFLALSLIACTKA